MGKRMFAGSRESVVILAVFVVCVTRAGHAVRMASFSLSLARSLSFCLRDTYITTLINQRFLSTNPFGKRRSRVMLQRWGCAGRGDRWESILTF